MMKSRQDSATHVSESREWIPCAMASCRDKAMSRIGEKNLCREHYDNHHMSDSLKWNAKMGLDTVDKRKDFVSKTIRLTIQEKVSAW